MNSSSAGAKFAPTAVEQVVSSARPLADALRQETTEFIAALSGELDHEALRDFIGPLIFGMHVGQALGTPVAEVLRFLDETDEAIRELIKRLHAMPPAMELQLHRVAPVTIQEAYRPARDRLIDGLTTIGKLLAPAREELAIQGNNPGAKNAQSRDSLLHVLALVITAHATCPITKLRVATIARDLLVLEGIKVPANAADVARLIREYRTVFHGSEIASHPGG